jgi:biopolymer transport protein ExbD
VWHAFVRLFNQGGWVLYPIFGVAVLSWYLAAGKMLQLRRLFAARKKFLSALAGKSGGSTGHESYDSLLSRLAAVRGNPALVERATREFMAEIKPFLASGIATIGACVVTAPLLGLLGTISGMNEMFSVIGEFGFGSPTIMANGISMALQATLTGLAVAVVALLFQDQLNNMKSRLTNAMEADNRALYKQARASQSRSGDPSGKEPVMYADYHLLPEQFEKPDINLAPFVDTIMILLIFFVVTANLYVETGVDVSKPKAQSAKPAGQKAVLVGVTREGTVHMYGRQVNLDRLKLLIEQEASKQADLSVVIVADREASTGRTVEVMDQCALGGAQKISISANKD